MFKQLTILTLVTALMILAPTKLLQSREKTVFRSMNSGHLQESLTLFKKCTEQMFYQLNSCEYYGDCPHKINQFNVFGGNFSSGPPSLLDGKIKKRIGEIMTE